MTRKKSASALSIISNDGKIECQRRPGKPDCRLPGDRKHTGTSGDILMAFFEPDENEYIHICRNPGGLVQEVIVQVGDRIEAHFL